MKILPIFIIPFLCSHICSIFAPSTFITMNPPLLQTGFIDAVKGETSVAVAPRWMNTFTRALTRIKLTATQTSKVILGIRGFGMYFAQNGLTRTNFKSSVSSPLTASFSVTIDVENENYLIYYKLTYLSVSSQFGGIFISEESFVMNTVMSSTYNITKTYTLPALSTSPPSQYEIGISIHSFEVAYKQVANTETTFFINWNDLGGGSLRLILWIPNTNQPYIGVIEYYLVVIPNHLFERFTDSNIISRGTLIINYLNMSHTDIDIEIHPTLIYPKTQHNYFQMIRGFTTLQNYGSFLFYITPNQKLYLLKDLRLSKIWAYSFFIYSLACPDPFYYHQTTLSCKKCLDYCLKCTSENTCDQCYDNFTLATTFDACLCPFPVVAGFCFDFTLSHLKNCALPVFNQSTNLIECISCPSSLFMKAVDSQCHCRPLFQFNTTTQQCEQICGDGAVFDHQCDDGNLFDGDGCSSLCKFQAGFNCSSQLPTVCLSEIAIEFRVITIMKNKDNSAEIILGITGLQLPFELTDNDFSLESFGIKLVKSYVPFEVVELNPSTIRLENRQITLRFEYGFTIEGMDSQIRIDMSKSRYPQSKPEINQPMKGSNFPLVYSSNIELFEDTSFGMMGSSLVLLLLLVFGMLAGKFIGVEGAVTIQLIYYSQLLISPIEKIPVGFLMFQYLKLVNGYSQIMKITQFSPKKNIQHKFHYLQLKKTFFQNFNISFALLFLSFITFSIFSVIRFCKQNQIMSFNQSLQINQLQDTSSKFLKDKKQTKENELKLEKNKLNLLLNLSSQTYNIVSQISFWCVLQFFAGVASQIIISNSQSFFVISQETQLIMRLFHIINKPVIISSFFIILVIGFNSFANILLSQRTFLKLLQRPMELNYKKVYFIYLCLIGLLVMFTNQVWIMIRIPMSLIVLLIHVMYVLVLIVINPYKMSLRIHSVGLFTCQGIYCLFLVFINLINLTDKMDDIEVLSIAYLILCCSGFIILLTIIRLYYEYKYGEELEKKIQKERQLQEKRRLQEEEAQIKRNIMRFQDEARKKSSLQEQQRYNNRYLFENQKTNEQQIQVLLWLQNRSNWSEQRREEYYFKKFRQKPLEWMKNRDKIHFERRLREQHERILKEKIKKDNLMNNPQYEQLVTKLKNEYRKKNSDPSP